MKAIRKKVLYLLKRSIEINYDTMEEPDDDDDEKVIQFWAHRISSSSSFSFLSFAYIFVGFCYFFENHSNN